MLLQSKPLMRRFAGDIFEGMQIHPADKSKIVHVFNVNDTLNNKPDNFPNTTMTKDDFFDAARSVTADDAISELTQILHATDNRIAIATARPAERLQETIDWLERHNVPFDQVMLSTGGEPSGVAKQAMLQKLQEDYRQVGTLFDDSSYNLQGVEMQGIPGVHPRKNDAYWEAYPETVYPYGLRTNMRRNSLNT